MTAFHQKQNNIFKLDNVRKSNLFRSNHRIGVAVTMHGDWFNCKCSTKPESNNNLLYK